MMQSGELSFPSAAPESERGPAACFYLAGCLRVYGELFEDALRRESRFTAAVLRQWQLSTLQFRAATAPLQRFLGRPWEGLSADFIPKNRSRWYFVVEKVQLALDMLRKEEPEPIRDLYAALEAVTSAVQGLRVWQLRLAAEHTDPSVETTAVNIFGAPRHDSQRHAICDVSKVDCRVAQRETDLVCQAFRRAVAGGDAAESCAASRRLFLHLYYNAVAYAPLWTSKLHGEVIGLHRTAIDIMSPGRFRERVIHRFNVLVDLGPDAFHARAVVLPVSAPAATEPSATNCA